MFFFKNKSQISIFVIISLILVLVGVYFVYLEFYEINEETGSFESLTLVENSNDVKLYIDSCYENSYFKSLQNVGFHGGVFEVKDNIPINFKGLDNLKDFKYTPFLINNYSLISKIDIISKELGKGLNYYFDDCLKNYSKVNLSYDIGKIKTNVEILDNNQIRVNSNLLISFEGLLKKFTFSYFSYVDTYSYLINYLDLSKVIVDQILEKPGKICISCNKRLEYQSGVEIFTTELISENYNGVIYYLINKDLEYNDIKYFSFLYLYDGGKN